MSFQQGLSGLNAASRNLEVIGNNVANASTVGFKASRAQFADVYATTVAGSSQAQAGIGVVVNTVTQVFGQGNLDITNNALDVAVNGEGFFRLSKNGAISFTRNGQFEIDKNGYVSNTLGNQLTGYPVNPTTGKVLQTSSAAPIKVDTADISPRASTEAQLVANLDSRNAALLPGSFNFNDASTYHNTTTVQIFDSLGNAHNLSLYFMKNAANTWQVRAQLDGAAVAGGGVVGTINFGSDGQINTGTTTLPFPLSLTLGNGATTPQAVNLQFNRTTQFGSAFGVTSVVQDGYTSGRLLGFSIGSDGVIQGRYTNGQTRAQGQIVLASFVNNQGLQPLGNNGWAETSDSGQALVGAPNSGSLGVLQSGALEDSNTDLTGELVNMITAQRVYQANAQTIRTQDALLQTLVTLR